MKTIKSAKVLDSKKQICAGHPVKIKPVQYFEYHGDKSGQTLQFYQINEINIKHNHSRVSIKLLILVIKLLILVLKYTKLSEISLQLPLKNLLIRIPIS